MNYISGEGSVALETPNKILCCQCGVPIVPNPSNMCVGCLRTQVDITENIPKQVVIYFCKFCERYLNPPSTWVVAALESRELMALCLNRLKNLPKVKLIDANFLWTEPHSKRIKLKLTVQGEVTNTSTILQQTFVVEYIVNGQMCDDCRRVEAKDTWNACVQVRQKTNQKKTLFYLEQLLIKYEATRTCLSIKPVHDGLDFYFGTESNARKLVDFLNSMIPIRYRTSQTLISHDDHSNTYNYKFTYSVEVVPICKDNLVCLPARVAHGLGSIGQVCIAQKVTSLIHYIDPTTCQVAEMSSVEYFKTPFRGLMGSKQLTEYTIMNIERVQEKDRRKFAGQGAVSKKHVLADAWVVRSSELGLTQDTIHCKTHLGHLLQPGDVALGYDLRNTNVNDDNLEKMPLDRVPDIVLVKKIYAEKSLRNRRRQWKLRHMDGLHEKRMDTSSQGDDEYQHFLEDLEEDPELRQNVNIYKDKRKLAALVDGDDLDDESVPQISLAEMLDDLVLTSPNDDRVSHLEPGEMAE